MNIKRVIVILNCKDLEGSEWATCSDGKDNTGDLEVSHAPRLGEEYEEIKKVFAEGWKIKMEN